VNIGGGWRPSAAHELLLDATLGPEPRAAAAFARWRAMHSLDSLDPGSTRLLPLLVPRAHLFDAHDLAWPVIRGCYRRAFVHGQLVSRRAIDAIARLSTAGIPVLALKGGALFAYYDHNPALRPMNDFDVLVPRAHAEAAIRILLAAGWSCPWPDPESLPEVYHGAGFESADGLDFDLHWQPLAAAGDSDDAAIWDASVETSVPGGTLRAPCAADLLTIVCAHASSWSPLPPVRWVADALKIVGREGAQFDWSRVVSRAQAWRVTLPLHDTLDYLAQRWAVDVPASALRALADTPAHRIDRHAYVVLGRMPTILDYILRPWERYRLRSFGVPAWKSLPGFMRYLRITLGLRGSRQLPREIVDRIVRFRRDRRSGLR